MNSVNTLFKLGWLPLSQRRDWHLLKAAHKALYFEHWPKNLRLETVQHGRCLRSSETINLKIPLESGTFQDCAAKRFNPPPPGCNDTTLAREDSTKNVLLSPEFV